MPQSPRAELLAIQKKLWRWNQELIDGSILVKEPGFDRYERNYRRAGRDYARAADQDEMIDAVLASDIIYVGVYHTCNQSQRSFLRILKAVVKRDRHFLVLDSEGIPHAGIAFWHSKRRDIGQLVLDLVLLWRVVTAEEMRARVEYL